MYKLVIIFLSFIMFSFLQADGLFDESINKSGRMKIASYVTSQGTQISIEDIQNSSGLIEFTNKITSQVTNQIPKEFYFHREDLKTFKSKDFRKWTLIPSVTSIGGEENIQKESSLTISPNPVSDFLTIYGHDGEKFEIYSVYGIKIIEGTCQVKIDISYLPAGLYFVRIGNKVQKFVKIF